MNHAFVTSRKTIRADVLHTTLLSIIKDRFPSGKVLVNRTNDHWRVEYSEVPNGWPYCLDLWLESSRKIAFRRAPGDWSSWLQYFLQEKLATHFSGTCSDEGVSDRWKPDAKLKYHSVIEWSQMICGDGFGPDKTEEQASFIKDLVHRLTKRIPKDLL